MHHNVKDLRGQRFGHLTVLKFSDERIKGNPSWECECDCGNKEVVPAWALRDGKKIKCSDKKAHGLDLVGKKFGKLRVLKKTYSTGFTYFCKSRNKKVTSHKANFVCECDCGQIVVKGASGLRTAKYKACNTCMYKKRPQSTRHKSSLERLFHKSIVSRCKKTDGRIENKLTVEEFGDIISKNCHYCGEEPEVKMYISNNKHKKVPDLYANGIDRLDPSGHYELGNCVPCCKHCNRAKSDLTQKEFFSKIKRIYNHLNLSEE